MKQQCPLCPKWHDSDDYDEEWVFVCSAGCNLLRWHRDESGTLALEVAPGAFPDNDEDDP